MVLSTLLACATALFATGCGASSPTSPSQSASPPPVAQTRLALACSGQSNAVELCFGTPTSPGSFLAPYADQVAFAEGSRPISYWDADWDCWTRLRDVLSANHPRLDAFVWWQGENNWMDPSGYYRAKLADLVARVRLTVGNPNLRILVVQTGIRDDTRATILTEQLAFIAHDRNAVLVPTGDLAFPDGGVHMEDAGYRIVAQRIAQLARP